MARPEIKEITFTVDGREVTAPEGAMLVDAARIGDIEIPYFCYEPKLGAPVGACRMCLVEIEGIPKLQTSCSTPVKEGMVVNTTIERVQAAQNAVVEFLLVNHPLDCPVCDKGGECPLQDISYGWGLGTSRTIEPKRHFKKPLELSPLVAIDRERCILCYRCVRFSQELAEDGQLQFVERGDHTFVGTHDGAPYVAPFSGNIIELCPVGALTSTAYRFRARPWDVEEAGSVCTGCATQCNVSFTVRDDAKVLRVLDRQNDEVDDGWLCDKGRFGYQSFHSPDRISQPHVRDGGELRPVSWERALETAASALAKAGEKTAALVGGGTTNEEGFLLQHLLRNGLGSPHLAVPGHGDPTAEQSRILARPDLSARISDIDHAGAILVVECEPVDEAAGLDLRIRKARRRHHTRVITLSSRPSALDADESTAITGEAGAIPVRFAPGAAEAAIAALAAAVGAARAGGASGAAHASRAGADVSAIEAAAAALKDAGDVVVVWGERVLAGDRGTAALDALLALAEGLGLAEKPESGLLGVSAAPNARGLRDAGVSPVLGPGLQNAPAEGASARDIGRAGAAGDLTALILWDAAPLTELPERGVWERALDTTPTVIASAHFLDDALLEHATVVFPALSNAEQEGTVTNLDGRLQRVRQACALRGEVRQSWSVLADICKRAGADVDALTGPMVFNAMVAAAPILAGIDLGEIGGQGVRWQDRESASALGAPELPTGPLETPPELVIPGAQDGLLLGAIPSIWTGDMTANSPSLRFLVPSQRAELSPTDAQRLGVGGGDRVVVSAGDDSVEATVALRSKQLPGSVFLIQGTGEDDATNLMNGVPRVVEVRPA